MTPVEAPTSARGLLNHQAIIDAVAEAIDTVGVRHFRMGDVAVRAGVTRQTVTNHFHTKDELIRAFLLSEVARLVEVTTAGLDPDAELATQLRPRIELVVTFLTSRPSFQPPLVADWITYLTVKAPYLGSEFEDLLADELGHALGRDRAACRAAGQVLWRLIYSYVTQPPPDTTTDEQVDAITRAVAAQLV